MEDRTLRKIKWIGAAAAALFSYAVFFATMAPTVSFWDCGEFIAVSNILGIPHPPGTPFFVILGRMAILLMPWIDEVAMRVNMISVVSSALAVFFSYLVAWEVLAAWLRRKDELGAPYAKWALPVAGLVGAFLVAFSDTFWFNAVEAEVYGLAMCFVFGVTWLSLVWSRHAETPFGDRLLVLIVYVAYLGIGVQLYTLITLPALFAFALAVDRRLRAPSAWPVWAVCVLLYAVVYAVEWFPEILALSIAATAVGALLHRAKDADPDKARAWRLAFWFATLALVGFSNHAYIPIRSALDPAIDENDPEISVERVVDLLDQDNWGRFNGFLARKQYGSESMIARAFHRRAQVSHQLLSWPHMGFGGYQFAQYLPWKVGEVRFTREYGKFAVAEEDNPPTTKLGIDFPTQMMLFKGNEAVPFVLFVLFNGLVFLVCLRLWKRDRTTASYVGALYLITTMGLLFYMNFADGLGSERYAYEQWEKNGRPAPGPQTVQMEVRERDYFYTPGFMMMGIVFGIGAGMAVCALWRRRKETDDGSLARGAAAAMVVLSAAVPIWSNYAEHDRSGNFIPWDYAYNLLMSCEPDGILITNGDNDTFPLWFAQEVEGIRTDVRVVNLSLGNTDWYIRQILENRPANQLPLRLTDLKQKLEQGIVEDVRGLVIADANFAKSVEATLSYADSMLVRAEAMRASLEASKDSLVAARGEEEYNARAKIAEANRAAVLNHIQTFTALRDWLRQYNPGYLKTQDQLVLDLVLSNPDRPFHVATTVGRENFMGLERYMDMQGMVYTLRRGEREPQGRLDFDRTVALVDSVYRFRCLDDSSCYVNEETRRLLYNYNSIYFRVIMEARRELASAMPLLRAVAANDSLKTPEVEAMRSDVAARAAKYLPVGHRFLERALRQFPTEWRVYVVGAEFLLTAGDYSGAVALLRRGLESVPEYDRREISDRLRDLAGAGEPEAKEGKNG